MYFRQIVNEDTSCLSYAVGCPTYGECIIVDPQRNISPYLDISENSGMQISMIMETHIHADHLSGARKLQEKTGAPIYLSELAEVKFPFEILKDRETITMGNRQIIVRNTPGHTKESTSFLVDARLLLTGDALFVGDVGRMDLEGAGTVEQLYHSIFNCLMEYGDLTEVYPAHYGNSACGTGMENKTSSTIGFEKKNNRLLGSSDLETFRRHIAETQLKEVPEFKETRRKNMNGE